MNEKSYKHIVQNIQSSTLSSSKIKNKNRLKKKENNKLLLK